MSIAGPGEAAAPRGMVGRVGACGWYIESKPTRGGDLAVGQQPLETGLIHHLDTELGRASELAPGLRPRDEQIGLRAHRARGLAAERAHQLLGLLARSPLERAGEDDGLARERPRGRRPRLREHGLDAGASELVEELALFGAREELFDRARDDRAHAFDRLELLDRRGAKRLDDIAHRRVRSQTS